MTKDQTTLILLGITALGAGIYISKITRKLTECKRQQQKAAAMLSEAMPDLQEIKDYVENN